MPNRWASCGTTRRGCGTDDHELTGVAPRGRKGDARPRGDLTSLGIRKLTARDQDHIDDLPDATDSNG